MVTQVDARQSRYRSILDQLDDSSNLYIDTVLGLINLELTPSLRLYASPTPDLTLHIGPSVVQTFDGTDGTQRNKTIPPVGNQALLPSFNGGTILFPAISGGTAIVTPGNNVVLPSIGLGEYVRAAIALDGNGYLVLTFGTPSASMSGASMPISVPETYPIGCVVIQNIGGVIQNIENSNIYQFTGGTTEDSAVQYVEKTLHGFTVGDLLYIDASGNWAKAIATAENTMAMAIVRSVVDANTFSIQFNGQVSNLSGLTAGTIYYLSTTIPGATTVVAPSSGIQQMVYRATSTTSAILMPMGLNALPFHDHTDAGNGGQITDAALSSPVSMSKGGTGLTTMGAAYQTYRMNGTATGLEWTNQGTGDVVGPTSAVDGSLVRFDTGTGKLVQGYTSSPILAGDTGTLTVQNSTVATSSSSGALVVAGGAGIGEKLYVGTSVNTPMVSTPVVSVTAGGTAASGRITFTGSTWTIGNGPTISEAGSATFNTSVNTNAVVASTVQGSIRVSTPLVKAYDANGIKFQENGGVEVGSVASSGGVWILGASGTTTGFFHSINGGVNIYGDSLVKGSGNTNASSCQTWRNSSNTMLGSVNNAGSWELGPTTGTQTNTSSGYTALGNATTKGANGITPAFAVLKLEDTWLASTSQLIIPHSLATLGRIIAIYGTITIGSEKYSIPGFIPGTNPRHVTTSATNAAIFLMSADTSLTLQNLSTLARSVEIYVVYEAF